MKMLIVAGGAVPESPLALEAIDAAEFILAADRGAEAAIRFGRVPNLVVGDFDSLAPAARQFLQDQGVPLVEYPTRKDKTDLHLALQTASERGATSITLLGLLGGERTDHGVAALLLLAREEFAHLGLRVIDGAAEIWVTRDRVNLRGRKGEYVTLLAISPHTHGVTATGLEYPLFEASLSFGDSLGVSNELAQAEAVVTVREGALVVIHQHVFE